MNIEEINRREESFRRTEKSLDDEHISHVMKVKRFTIEYNDFVRSVRSEGYEWTSSGWKKVKN